MNSALPKILVGICSCQADESYATRRQAIRETWLARKVEGIECCFFVGGEALPEESDVRVLKVSDAYEFLPAKVVTFFAEALSTSNFEWLFKCDDDTYVCLDRLASIIDGAHDLIGNEFVRTRGSPSGGAGYMLSRKLVELLVHDANIAATGCEDILIGEAAIRNGARTKSTDLLSWDCSSTPMIGNEMVSCHWCSPQKLRVIDFEVRNAPSKTVIARHAVWQDNLLFYGDAHFRRAGTGCSGTWHEMPEGKIALNWIGWGAEVLLPPEATVKAC